MGAAYIMPDGPTAVVWRHSPMTQKDGYIIEYYQLGNSVKVTAFDPQTLTEVAIIGVPGLSREALARNAVRKLEYVMAKNQAKSEQ